MNAKKNLVRLGMYLVLTIFALIIILPFIIALLGSFREQMGIIVNGPLALPKSWDLSTFKTVILEYNFDRYLLNSTIITVPTVIFSLVFAIMASYVLSFMDFLFKRSLTLFIMFGIMIPAEFIMIPLYYLMNNLGLIDTYAAAILPQLAMSACFSTLIIRSFFLGIPSELVDSGLVDGAGSWSVLWRILVPIAKPAIITSAALTTVWTWNAYILPLVLIPTPQKAPLPVGLVLFQGNYTTDIPQTMAGTIFAAIPMVLVYLVLQRHFIRGLTQGAVD